jgi:hypothetical protein
LKNNDIKEWFKKFCALISIFYFQGSFS